MAFHPSPCKAGAGASAGSPELPGAAAGPWAGPGAVTPRPRGTHPIHGGGRRASLHTVLHVSPPPSSQRGSCVWTAQQRLPQGANPGPVPRPRESSHGPLLHSSRIFSLWKLTARLPRWPSDSPATWLPVHKVGRGQLPTRWGSVGGCVWRGSSSVLS